MLLLELLVGAGEHVEDGGSREGHDEDATEDAAQCHDLPGKGSRHHVTIAHSCHGDNGPPVGGGDAAEVVGTRELAFSQVNQWGEEGDRHTEEKQEEAKLPRAAPDRQPECLQAERVASQPHHVENPQRPQDPQHQTQLVQVDFTSSWLLVVQGRILLCYHKRHIIRQDGHGVDNVERPAEEDQLAWSLNKPKDELQGEPGHTHCLYDEHVLALGGTLALR